MKECFASSSREMHWQCVNEDYPKWIARGNHQAYQLTIYCPYC
jgi:hypothetical protein